jgi:hypothetical protein
VYRDANFAVIDSIGLVDGGGDGEGGEEGEEDGGGLHVGLLEDVIGVVVVLMWLGFEDRRLDCDARVESPMKVFLYILASELLFALFASEGVDLRVFGVLCDEPNIAVLVLGCIE